MNFKTRSKAVGILMLALIFIAITIMAPGFIANKAQAFKLPSILATVSVSTGSFLPKGKYRSKTSTATNLTTADTLVFPATKLGCNGWEIFIANTDTSQIDEIDMWVNPVASVLAVDGAESVDIVAGMTGTYKTTQTGIFTNCTTLNTDKACIITGAPKAGCGLYFALKLSATAETDVTVIYNEYY